MAKKKAFMLLAMMSLTAASAPPIAWSAPATQSSTEAVVSPARDQLPSPETVLNPGGNLGLTDGFNNAGELSGRRRSPIGRSARPPARTSGGPSRELECAWYWAER